MEVRRESGEAEVTHWCQRGWKGKLSQQLHKAAKGHMDNAFLRTVPSKGKRKQGTLGSID